MKGIKMDNLRKWLANNKVFLSDFHVETAKADPFVYERPGPGFHGEAYTDHYTDGDEKAVQEGARYGYPCFDDRWPPDRVRPVSPNPIGWIRGGFSYAYKTREGGWLK